MIKLVANRAVDPGSKLAAAEWVSAYRAMDLLVAADAQAKVQEAVFFAVADLLSLEVDVLFFDSTSTYWERDTEEVGEDAFRRYGHSEDHRKDPDVASEVVGTVQNMGQAAVRVRLDVNDARAGVLWRAAGARRFAHNWAVATIKANDDQWHAEATYDIGKSDRVRALTYFDLAKLWTAAKPTVAPWAGEHSTWAFLYGIRAAAEAHKAFLKGQRRFPRFKSRHRDRARFTVRDGLHLENGRVRVGKYDWVRIAVPCAAQAKLRRLIRRGHARLLNVTATRHSDGNWYATLCYDRPARVPAQRHMPPAGPVVGVDRGVRTSAVVATAGRQLVAELAGVRALRNARRKVAHLQRDFSRTAKGSANRKKTAVRLARAHARVGAVRADALHTHFHRKGGPLRSQSKLCVPT